MAPPAEDARAGMANRDPARSEAVEMRRVRKPGAGFRHLRMARTAPGPIEDVGHLPARLPGLADAVSCNARRQIGPDRAAVGEWMKAAPADRRAGRAEVYLHDRPAGARAREERLGFEHEAAAAQRHLVEQRQRVAPEPRLRVADRR